MDVWITNFHGYGQEKFLIGVFSTYELALDAIAYFQKVNDFSDFWGGPDKRNGSDRYYCDEGFYTIRGVNLDDTYC